jgi:hypothetical protein
MDSISPKQFNFPRPDWVILGMTQPNGLGVRLIASEQLTLAQLEAKFDHMPIWDGALEPVRYRMTSYSIELMVGMRTCRMVDGPDYPTCFKDLFGTWAPQARIAIEE